MVARAAFALAVIALAFVLGVTVHPALLLILLVLLFLFI